MFGMSLPEILVIAVIAVLVLGPDKLPEAMVQIAKFFKMFKKGINDAKSTFDQEVKIAELKEDAKKYKESIESATQSVRKKLTFEELDELKKGVAGVASEITNAAGGIKSAVDTLNNPGEAIKEAVLGGSAASGAQDAANGEASRAAGEKGEVKAGEADGDARNSANQGAVSGATVNENLDKKEA